MTNKYPETKGLLREMFPGRRFANLTLQEANSFRAEWLRRRRGAARAAGLPVHGYAHYHANKTAINERRRRQHAANPSIRNRHTSNWRKRHPEKYRETRRKWRAKNPEKVKAGRAAWARRYPERCYAGQKRRQLIKTYGLTIQQFEALLKKQNHQCAICGATKANSRGHKLYVDHNHVTGAVRGLLCGKCNSAIGYFSECSATLIKAAEYVSDAAETNLDYRRSTVQQILGSVPEACSQEGRSEGVVTIESIRRTG